MDLSKLPKFSETKPPAPDPAAPAAEEPQALPVDYGSVQPKIQSGWGPEAWISVGLGLILLLVFPHFTQWLLYAVFHTKPPGFLPITDSNTGAQIPYPQSVFFMSDLCIALFGYALIIEGIVLLLARRAGAVLFAFVITSAAVLLNLYYLIASFSSGEGFALVSGVAVLVGGYMAMYQWRLMQEMRAVRKYTTPARQ